MLRIIYIATTLLLALGVGIAGGVMDIIQPQGVKDIALHLGYPLYFFFLLGIFKVTGGVALLLPKIFDSIRNIAYLGFSFDFIFASFSHYSIGDDFLKIITPLIVLTILIISYILKGKFSLYKKQDLVK